MATRRDALVTLATASASIALANERQEQPAGHHMHEDGPQAEEAKVSRSPTFFTGREYDTVSRIADLIIPRTDTPGAADVGVPWRIDRTVAQDGDLQKVYTQALANLNEAARDLGSQDFITLTQDQQITLLKALEEKSGEPGSKFFQSMKELTIKWYYNSEPGLVQELGFKGNTYRTEFPGCTHSEHWPS
jgi:hypothetical protein